MHNNHNTQMEDLKIELLHWKRENLKLKNENEAMKVKLRKMQSAMAQKHKLIDNLICPNTSSKLRKDFLENGVSVATALKGENESLKEKVAQNELIIKKLQRKLESYKLYVSSGSNIKTIKTKKHKLDSRSNRSSASKENLIKERSAPTSEIYPNFKPAVYQERQFNMQDIDKIEKSIGYDSDFTSGHSSPRKIDLPEDEITELAEKEFKDGFPGISPHVEIERLHYYFEDVLKEVESLKESIFVIQKKQA